MHGVSNQHRMNRQYIVLWQVLPQVPSLALYKQLLRYIQCRERNLAYRMRRRVLWGCAERSYSLLTGGHTDQRRLTSINRPG